MATFASFFAPPADAQEVAGLKIARSSVEFGQHAGQASVMVWRGKAQKPFANYRFRSVEAREEYISRLINSEEGVNRLKADRKAAEKAAKAAFVPNVKVGDIFANSWGYEQTNVDFYQVVRLVGKSSVALRKINGRSHDNPGGSSMSAYVSPVKDAFSTVSPDEIVKRLHPSGGSCIVNFAYGCGSLTNENEKHYSSWYA